jgi:gas vesicle protein
MNNNGKILVALAAGIAVGAVAGILFAPDKGSETRRKINEKGKKFAEEFKEKFSRAKEKANDMKEEFRKTAKETAEEFV